MTFIETAPPDYRLAGLYVIDAISRAAHKQVRKAAEANVNKPLDVENYLRRFAVVFREGALAGCFESCSGKDKVRRNAVVSLRAIREKVAAAAAAAAEHKSCLP